MIKYMHKTYRMGEKFFPGIQALRALAALIVTYGHVLHEALTMRGGEVMSYIPYPTSVGIDAFFAISGFVIYISGYKLIDETNGYISFLKKRFVRVVPLYWFYTTLMLLVILILPGAVGTAQADFWHVVQSYLFIPHERPHGDGLKPLLALGWTLNYEIYFYAIFALVMAFVKSRFLAVLSLFFIGTSVLGILYPMPVDVLWFWFHPLVLEFLFGVLIAAMVVRGIRPPPGTLWLFIALAIVSAVLLAFPERDNPLLYVVKGACGCLFLLAFALPKDVEKMPVPRVFKALGDSSYSLYLSHPFVIGATSLIWMYFDLSDVMSLWFYVGGTVIACMIAGHISYLVIEIPTLRFLKKRFMPQKQVS